MASAAAAVGALFAPSHFYVANGTYGTLRVHITYKRKKRRGIKSKIRKYGAILAGSHSDGEDECLRDTDEDVVVDVESWRILSFRFASECVVQIFRRDFGVGSECIFGPDTPRERKSIIVAENGIRFSKTVDHSNYEDDGWWYKLGSDRYVKLVRDEDVFTCCCIRGCYWS